MHFAQVVHALPRRVHLRAPALAGHTEACRRIAHRLAESIACDTIDVRPMTGSVFVTASEEALDPREIANQLLQLVAEERDELGRPLTAPHEEHLPGPTRIARVVAHAFHEINNDVRNALDQRADLGTLLPVFFAFGGLAEVAATKTLPAPPWFNLLWWSIRSFMTFNRGAMEEEARAHENGGATGPNGHSRDEGSANGDHGDGSEAGGAR